MSLLRVHLHEQYVGILDRSDEDPLNLRFAYDSAHVYSGGPALSVSLPLRSEPYIGPAARNWFANLLPEGGARQHLAALFGLAIQDDFGLLAAIGRECAGAVSLWPAQESAPAAEQGTTRPLSHAQIEQWAARRPRGAISTDRPARLSLAGAQDKIGVVVEADGSLSEPVEGTISSHILKAPNQDYPGLIHLEAMGLRLARAAGLTVPTVALIGSTAACLLVERFDRTKTAAGTFTRIHQEDFCQALGLPPEHKYQADGGPSLVRCFELVRRLGLGAAALNALIDWTAYNVVIANADAHGKNLALLHRQDRTIALAPFYDMVPTGTFPGNLVDRSLAMALGNARSVDEVRPQDWDTFARACGLTPRYVTGRLAAVVEHVQAALQTTAEELIAQGAEPRVIAKASQMIAQRCDAILSGNPLPVPEATNTSVGAWGMSL